MLARWKTLGRLEKVFLGVVLLYLALLFSRSSSTDPLATLLYILGAVLAFRYTRRAIRKSIWHLRNRLIVSYLFIAVVPIVLLVSLVGILSYVLIGEMAVYIINSELNRRLDESVAAAPGSKPPVTPELISNLAPHLGDAFLLNEQGSVLLPLAGRDFRRRVPPSLHLLDIEISYFSPIVLDGRTAVLWVRTRPTAVLSAVFGDRLEWRQGVLVAAAIVTGLFLIVQISSIVVGVSITRTITAAVNELYEGTQHINAGEFSHRIAVQGNDQLAELAVSFNQMTGNLERLISVEKEKERMHSELEIAREVQKRLFPKAAPALRTLQLTGVCHPAQMVSGDYYDFLSLEGDTRLAMAIGDVAGKGISAALLMAAMQSVMRTQLADAGVISPRRIVTLMNRQLYDNTAPEKYATFFFGVFDEPSSVLTYTNAGHLPPVLVRNGTSSQLEVTGTVVGAFPVCQYEEKTLKLENGDVLVAYTDGITEPEDAYGEMFGEQRLMDLVVKYQNSDVQEIVSRITEAVNHWSSSPEQQDDMTLIVARRVS